MKNLSFLIKPASSSCNFKCNYCFYNDVSNHRTIKNSGYMTLETMQRLIDEAFKIIDDHGEITFIFQGGEPTIIGIEYFESFTSYVEEKNVKQCTINYTIQTNASLIDIRFCELFKKYNFLVGISLDGYQENHDFFRITQKNKATYEQVMNTIALLKQYNVEFNILTVLSKQLAKNPQKLYQFYKENKFHYVQLIPCLKGFDEESNPFALTYTLFSSFYKKLFDLWIEDFKNGNYISFNLFDNLILMYNGLPPYQCGYLGFCTMQLVVEADGSIYPCDFYVLDQYNGGNINDKDLLEIMQHPHMTHFLKEEKDTYALCEKCFFRQICNGNCKRMNEIFFDETHCGYQEFLAYSYPVLSTITLN